MAVTKVATQVTWSAAVSQSVTAAGNNTSDANTFDAASFGATIQVKAKNNGTPASGDKVEMYLLRTNGDVDAAPDVTDDYDTTVQGMLLAVLDTFITDPAVATIDINPIAKGYKVYALSKAASNGITVSAQVYEAKG